MCNALDPKAPLADAMFDRAEILGRDSGHWSIRIGFFEAASRAILEGDADFFREVARLLETRLNGPPYRRYDLAVLHAFNSLHSRTGKLPTKKQVRESALKEIAMDDVMNRQPNGWDDCTHFPPDGGKRMYKPEFLREVRKRIDLLPEQNWKVIFKRCGLSHLPNDKGGQPAHRKRPYYG